ncbi:MAG: response regulator [Pseudomonadota bacterium]
MVIASSVGPLAHIVVIDDDPATLESFAVLLGVDGFAVTTFEGGQAFLSALPSLTADCVLLDIRMPGIDGLDVLRLLKRDGFSRPVILMTASPKLISPERARRLGAATILEKPISEVALTDAISGAVAHQAQNQGRRGDYL